MPNAPVRYFPEATQEVEEAFEWYLERSPRAAEAFLREVERALAIIVSAPQVWPTFESGTYKYVLRNFPYNIIYRQDLGHIAVVAVAHHKRQPRYWHRRLEP